MPNLGPSGTSEEGTLTSVGVDDEGAGGVDVNKLDSAALQDVIQYSGVDLKAEADLILRGHETFLAAPAGRDPRMHHEHLFNGPRLKALVSAAVVPRGITDMSEDCLDMIALSVQRRLADVVAALIDISKHRTDWARAHFKIKIENDPKRQLWLVDQYLAGECERVRAGQGGLGSADALALARAKMKKVEKRASEDVAVKTKLANVTAAVATGLQLKSWMTDSSALNSPLPDASSSGIPTPTESGTTGKAPIHFSQAPSMTPISDRELQAQFSSRYISIKDFIYFAENDPHLRRSNILLSLYHQQGALASQ